MPNLLLARLPCECGLTEVPSVNRAFLIGDLHLSWRKIGALRRFSSFLRKDALACQELFILGDLFEYWLGDDAAWIATPVTRALRRFADTGRKLYLMQGNRDVILGDRYAELCHAELLADEVVMPCGARKFLLSHGDKWCTLDADYQAFRAKMRSIEFQREAFSKTVRERIAWASKARAVSTHQKRIKSAEEMDVVTEEVNAAAKRRGCVAVIHGHTHHVAAHVQQAVPRYVVDDWELDFTVRPHFGWIDVAPGADPKLVFGAL